MSVVVLLVAFTRLVVSQLGQVLFQSNCFCISACCLRLVVSILSVTSIGPDLVSGNRCLSLLMRASLEVKASVWWN